SKLCSREFPASRVKQFPKGRTTGHITVVTAVTVHFGRRIEQAAPPNSYGDQLKIIFCSQSFLQTSSPDNFFSARFTYEENVMEAGRPLIDFVPSKCYVVSSFGSSC
ncbi:hypothetical protein AMECASPLE_011053, partial [Ameca splendens]